MKKIAVMILSVLLVFTAFAAPAEAEEGKLAPMFATVGEAMEASGEYPIAGGNEEYFSVITEQDWTWYRHVAYMDEKAKELYNAISTADSEEMEAAFEASEEYNKTLPIAYSEAFTVYPMSQEEMDALVGKTLGELRAEGYEDSMSQVFEGDVIFVMRAGLFEYGMTVDADAGTYAEAVIHDESGNPGGDFVVRSVELYNITLDACMLEVHTDGTVEKEPDPFADLTEVTIALVEKVQAIANGEEADLDAFGAGLKEQYPDMAEMVDVYLEMYQVLGADAFISVLNSAAEDTVPQE